LENFKFGIATKEDECYESFEAIIGMAYPNPEKLADVMFFD
jgi:hypothetical protein